MVKADLISVVEAGEILKVTPKRVRDYINEGRLKAEQVGRAFVLERRDVEAFEPMAKGRPSKASKSKSKK